MRPWSRSRLSDRGAVERAPAARRVPARCAERAAPTTRRRAPLAGSPAPRRTPRSAARCRACRSPGRTPATSTRRRSSCPAPAAAPPAVTITPQDQLDGTATLDVPLVDLASFAADRGGPHRRPGGRDAAGRHRAAGPGRSCRRTTTSSSPTWRSSRPRAGPSRSPGRACGSRRQRHRAGADRAPRRGPRAGRGGAQRPAARERGAPGLARRARAPSRSPGSTRSSRVRRASPTTSTRSPRSSGSRLRTTELPGARRGNPGPRRAGAAGQGRAPLPRPQPERERHGAGHQRRGARRPGRLLAGAWSGSPGRSTSPPSPGSAREDAAADGARAREQRARLAARDDIHRAWATVRNQHRAEPLGARPGGGQRAGRGARARALPGRHGGAARSAPGAARRLRRGRRAHPGGRRSRQLARAAPGGRGEEPPRAPPVKGTP